MNGQNRLPQFRERFYRRERRSVPAAKGFVGAALSAWEVEERRDEVLLCVSEMATNALVHGVPPGRGFRLMLWLERDDVLRVEVHDSGEGSPEVDRPGPDGENGRGLMLVEALADKWGVGEREPGKVVWAEFAAGDAARAH
ncbi:ATP-binding protein [Streptomyces iconiensis]|uniref:ATP-binding protein n=1 Tax=Streptomyces iconiensis TaxID=1384038 RepID=A0ABT7A457_9ACTN|nr:ATP-binding protein [Streptomyces iconiensis]MDJ1136128.1 ATP-binding protein [Streptomyces iconiensis]